MHGVLHPVKARALLERTLATLRREPLSIHGDLSPEAALAVINERLSGRWFPWGATADRAVLGYAGATSIAVWAKRRDVASSGTQVFKGRVVGDGAGCVLVGSMRSFAYVRAWFYLGIGFTGFVVADAWGIFVWHAIGGGLTRDMIGVAVGAPFVPLVFFCFYAFTVAFSASDAVFLREWLSDCLGTDAPDRRGAHT